MTEQTKALHRLFDGIWNGEDPDVVDEPVGPESVIYDWEVASSMSP